MSNSMKNAFIRVNIGRIFSCGLITDTYFDKYEVPENVRIAMNSSTSDDPRDIPYICNITGELVNVEQQLLGDELPIPKRGSVMEYNGPFPDTGSCFALDTIFPMYDGTQKEARDIEVGDLMCGKDGTSREVTMVYFRLADTVLIQPKRKNHMSYSVTKDHILALKASGIAPHVSPSSGGKRYRVIYYARCNQGLCVRTDCSKTGIRKTEKGFGTREEAEEYLDQMLNDPYFDVVLHGDTFEMTIQDYENICQKDSAKRLKGYTGRLGIEKTFFDTELPIHPYLLGAWLGDGHHKEPLIYNSDPELVEFLYDHTESINMRIYEYPVKKGHTSMGGITATKDYSYLYIREHPSNGTRPNRFTQALKDLGIYGNKRIPRQYLEASDEVRYQVLTGLIDTDGSLKRNVKGSDKLATYAYEFAQGDCHEDLFNDILFLLDLLGINHTRTMVSQLKCKYNATYKDGREYHSCHRITMTGEKILGIHPLIERKQIETAIPDIKSKIKCNTTTGFAMADFDHPTEEDKRNNQVNCVGFCLKGEDKLVCLNDRTVVKV